MVILKGSPYLPKPYSMQTLDPEVSKTPRVLEGFRGVSTGPRHTLHMVNAHDWRPAKAKKTLNPPQELKRCTLNFLG